MWSAQSLVCSRLLRRPSWSAKWPTADLPTPERSVRCREWLRDPLWARGRNPRERAANSLATVSRVELQHRHALCLVDVEVRAVSSPAFLLPGPSVLVASSPVLPARAPCPYPLNKLTAPNPHPTILKISSFNENKKRFSLSLSA